jgi:hypothetical protein
MIPMFQSFLFRLFESEAPVLELLERNPFPDAPPKFVHLRLYR